MSFFRRMLSLAATFAGAMGCLGATQLWAQVQYLDQGWSPEIRQEFYTLSQGSRIMPYEWFIALEESDSQRSFARQRTLQLGYLANDNTTENPDKLPVGFVQDKDRITERKYLGLTCAACHTNQLQLGETTYQIDGAPALADIWGLLVGIDDSLKATRRSPEKFARFTSKVIGPSATAKAKRELEQDLDKFLAYWSKFIQDSRVDHPWGRGRLDAFGMIFNRVSSIDLGIPENSVKPDAPVSYPFLWGTSFQDRVQWNGTAPNGNDVERLGRNLGEVLGVFAQAEFRATKIFEVPQPARTSAKRRNLARLENILKTLWSPAWPENVIKLDADKKAAGEVLYTKHCAQCHEVVLHRQQNTPVTVTMTPLSEVQTDPKMAMNAALGTVSTGELKLLFLGQERVPRGEMLQRLVRLALVSPFRDVPAEGRLLPIISDDIFKPSEIKAFLREIGFGQPEALALAEALDKKLERYYDELRATIEAVASNEAIQFSAQQAPPTLKYKAAPLAGIWATAPYLHNGSVPNLYELLLPADERSKTFHVGSRKFDPVKVGFETQPTEGTTLFDTSLSGNSNSGHDTYGVFTEEERWQLVEYLKSL